ncbi:MAG TPA: Gfo/Idh/MocA family oxidoreductase [Chloroflexota bacterium]|nr:Gfo/Idh/MocA family oxidoreductase [Chloroflexota bacterium]
MTEPRVRVALIGAGSMANTYHYPSLASFSDVELVGICDLIVDKARETAQRLKIPADRVYVDYKKMLADLVPQVVYVLMPPQHLYEPAMHALKQGYHVFVEKPPALTTNQARMLAYTAGKHNCLTMTGFQRRFVPAVTALRNRVEERGAIHFAEVAFLKSTGDLSVPAGFYDGAIDPLTSDGIHAVDNLRWLCGGEVEEVRADVRQLYVPGPVPNAFFATVTFSTGAVGTVHYNTVTGRRIFRAEFHGPNITAYVDADRESTLVADNRQPETFSSAELGRAALAAGEELRPYHWLGFWHESRHFIDCVKSGRQPSSHFADAVKSMELVEEILRARRAT